jgi:hypothetical protein
LACCKRRAGLFSLRQRGFERTLLPKSADPEHAETDDPTFLIHAPHYGVAFGRPHVTGGVRKGHFEIIMLSVKPQFYFIDHIIFPDGYSFRHQAVSVDS